VGSYEHGGGPSGSIKGEECLYCVTIKLPKKGPTKYIE